MTMTHPGGTQRGPFRLLDLTVWFGTVGRGGKRRFSTQNNRMLPGDHPGVGEVIDVAAGLGVTNINTKRPIHYNLCEYIARTANRICLDLQLHPMTSNRCNRYTDDTNQNLARWRMDYHSSSLAPDKGETIERYEGTF